MPRTANDQFSIQLLIDRQPGGRVHVHSPEVPGLHLAGPDLATVRPDIDPVIKDLLLQNRRIVVEDIRWVPSLNAMEAAVDRGDDAVASAQVLVVTAHAA